MFFICHSILPSKITQDILRHPHSLWCPETSSNLAASPPSPGPVAPVAPHMRRVCPGAGARAARAARPCRGLAATAGALGNGHGLR